MPETLKQEPCKPDNKTIFEKEEFYTTHCQVCNMWCKIFKFRSCQIRLNALLAQGQDPFSTVRELEKLANFQSGESSSLPPSQNQPKKKLKPSRRGR